MNFSVFEIGPIWRPRRCRKKSTRESYDNSMNPIFIRWPNHDAELRRPNCIFIRGRILFLWKDSSTVNGTNEKVRAAMARTLWSRFQLPYFWNLDPGLLQKQRHVPLRFCSILAFRSSPFGTQSDAAAVIHDAIIKICIHIFLSQLLKLEIKPTSNYQFWCT